MYVIGLILHGSKNLKYKAREGGGQPRFKNEDDPAG